jgi:hypothetical protein
MRLVRHAGLDPASRGIRKSWIPAFAGMTPLRIPLVYGQTVTEEEFVEAKIRVCLMSLELGV